MAILDLKEQFTFYASYHNQRVNIAIHLLCIWPILATAILLLQYTPVCCATPSILENSPYFTDVKMNVATVAVLIYSVCYLLMEPVVGAIGVFLLMGILSISATVILIDFIH